ncbi:MAG: 3-hydroxyacyl-ACP dehydratase FabZ family protein [Desulfocapsaceae bacterium]|nr:3-hydroxyacyl-ACP dehydratase FabZ family protein [Desulfocapsaceae bacterium]MDP3695638.1 3-hydroxyacyl-ACP dehydratase FabZ family protein [Desulfocapsaceae bacterium]
MTIDPLITALIPHRPPFLWIDRIVSFENGAMVTEKTIPADLDIFKGHYPEYPILPGVILCEALFQTGALLIARMSQDAAETKSGIPVLTRIGGARFKRPVGPGSIIQMQVNVKEKIAGAWFLKGILRVNEKIAVQVDFSCAMTSPLLP